MVAIELCRRNSIGSTYRAPTVIEYREVSQEDASEMLAKEMANGYYWRIQPEDATGN